MNDLCYILLDGLFEYYPTDSWYWCEDEITFSDICDAVKTKVEVSQPYGDTWEYLALKEWTKEQLLGRIVYLINHPTEICEIGIDNLCDRDGLCPVPVIIDGNHRLAASAYLHSIGKLDKISCFYCGRMDLLEYLTGESNFKPESFL